MSTRCWLQDKECDWCEASSLVDGLDGGLIVGGVRTRCKVIAALWNIGASLDRVVDALKEAKEYDRE